MNTTMGLAQPAREAPRNSKPRAAGIARGHNWVGPNRWHVYVHCSECGRIFSPGKSNVGPCTAPERGAAPDASVGQEK